MIPDNYFLTVVVLLAVGTLSIRGAFIAFASKMNLSPKVRELFTYIPAAIFPAIVVPATFFYQGQVDWLGGKERFLIIIAAGIACYFIRSTFFVIVFGLSMLHLVSY